MNRLFAIALTLVFASPLVVLANGPIEDSVTENPHGTTKTSGTPAATTAKWQKADDQIIGKIAKPQLIKMKATAESLHSFLQDSCLANTDLHPIWHGNYLAEKTGDAIQLKYGIECDFTASPANGPATLSILVNDLSPLTGHLTINRQDVMTLPISAGVRNECPYFEIRTETAADPNGAVSADGAANPNSAANNGEANKNPQTIWLVTARPDMLPYTPVTRKEYLNMVISDLNATKEQIIADVKNRTPVHSAEEQAAEKKSVLESFNARYSGAELEMRTRNFLEQYKSDEDYLKENIEKATADVDTTVHMIQGMLNHLAAATLAAPAIVSPASSEFLGFRDGEPGMVMLIRPNPSFFEPGAAQEKPQFFLITWNGNTTDASTVDLAKLISKNLDTRILKEMLKK